MPPGTVLVYPVMPFWPMIVIHTVKAEDPVDMCQAIFYDGKVDTVYFGALGSWCRASEVTGE